MRHRATTWRTLARVGAVAVVCLLAPSVAAAAAPSCATAPPAYTGTDATVAALTALYQDEDANCAAVVARLDTLDTDGGSWSSTAHSDAGAQLAELGVVDGHVQQTTSAVQTGQTGQTGQTVALDGPTLGQLGGDAHGLHVDLWMLIGAVVACMLFDVFLRKVWP